MSELGHRINEEEAAGRALYHNGTTIEVVRMEVEKGLMN